MLRHFPRALAAGLIAFASPAFAAVGDSPLIVVPADQQLTLLRLLANAKPVVQVLLAGLVLALIAALLLWLLQLVRIGRRRSDGAAGAMAFLSALSAAGPLIGLFGGAYGLLDMFIGIANVRPTPSLSILAPGFAEAALCVCLGLLAAAVAVIAQRHLKARLFAASAASTDHAEALPRAMA